MICINGKLTDIRTHTNARTPVNLENVLNARTCALALPFTHNTSTHKNFGYLVYLSYAPKTPNPTYSHTLICTQTHAYMYKRAPRCAVNSENFYPWQSERERDAAAENKTTAKKRGRSSERWPSSHHAHASFMRERAVYTISVCVHSENFGHIYKTQQESGVIPPHPPSVAFPEDHKAREGHHTGDRCEPHHRVLSAQVLSARAPHRKSNYLFRVDVCVCGCTLGCTV